MKSVLVYERQDGGHHLPYLRLVLAALVEAGLEVSLCLDLPRQKRQQAMAYLSLFEPITEIPAPPQVKMRRTWDRATRAFSQSGCDLLFFNCLDEVASALLRRAAFGLCPTRALWGRVCGIYIRPRSLDTETGSFNEWLKKVGMRRLIRSGFFHRLWVLDQRTVTRQKLSAPPAPVHFLPDPWQGAYAFTRARARQALQLAADQCIVLHYGFGSRRKGLGLLLDAMETLGDTAPHLLRAGKTENDPSLRQQLDRLKADGKATLLERFLDDREEALCFAAADLVALPYIGHYGSSGILPRAALAGKPVLASDEGLVAERVAQHQLGWLHRSGDAGDLARKLLHAAKCLRGNTGLPKPTDLHSFAQATSPDAFKKALIISLA